MSLSRRVEFFFVLSADDNINHRFSAEHDNCGILKYVDGHGKQKHETVIIDCGFMKH